MSRCYIYVVDRDFGFAPNPFHGYCSLATCKPGIRRKAEIGDWVIGMGGTRLRATGRCIFAMCVTEVTSFDEYWQNPRYLDKKPVRNGSSKMMVGDNIYHRNVSTGEWLQFDSHHSNPDGTANEHNVINDTSTNRVLLSNHFYYFGKHAAVVPIEILNALGYRNGRNYRVYPEVVCAPLIQWLTDTLSDSLNIVAGDPFDFDDSERRYSVLDNKVR
jgi:hypothetical protein